MRMKHFAAAMLTLAAMMAAVPAAHADTACNPTLTGRINDNVVVPNGATCTLAGGVTVVGNVTVGIAATLNIGGDVAIGGNIQATQCAAVVISPYEIGGSGPVVVRGNVTIQQCTAPSGFVGALVPTVPAQTTYPVLIAGNFTCTNNSAGFDAVLGSVGGNVTFTNNSGPDIFFAAKSAVAGSAIGNNVTFNNNSGPTTSFVGYNAIGGNLACQGNSSIGNNGGPNQVAGNEQGQCSGL